MKTTKTTSKQRTSQNERQRTKSDAAADPIIAAAPIPNPVAAAVEPLSASVMAEITGILEECLPECDIDDAGNRGLIFDPTASPFQRTASNEESAVWTVGIEGKFSIDLRGKVPSKVAAFCRRMSKGLAIAAERIALVNDDRNLKLIRRCVNDIDYVPSLVDQDLSLNEFGEAVHDPLLAFKRARRSSLEQEQNATIDDLE